MNQRKLALLLAAVMMLSLCSLSVVAAETREAADEPPALTEPLPQDTPEGSAAALPAADGPERPEPEPATQPERPEPAPSPDAAGTITFANLSRRLHANNLTILALQESIDSVEEIDYEELKNDLRSNLNELADLIFIVSGMQGPFAAAPLQQSYDAMRETFDDLKEGKLQQDNADLVRQLKNAQDQVVMGMESLYIALVGMEQQSAALDRSQAAMDRSVAEMELRYQLGQISALTLQEVKAGRTSLVSGKETLGMNLKNGKMQLEMMLGAEITGTSTLTPLPVVTQKQLDQMDLEADLDHARAASYELLSARRTYEDAEAEYKDLLDRYSPDSKEHEYKAGLHTWESAKYNYAAAQDGFELKFRTLFNQVKDFTQVLTAAQTALALEQDHYATAQLTYEQGTISHNKLLEAEDKLNEAKDKVASTQLDLFSAYHNYRWAVEYGILN